MSRNKRKPEEETIMMPVEKDNKRSKVRVNFKTRIEIDFDHPPIQIMGDSKNLSLKGIFVVTTENVLLNARCRVQVFLSGTASPCSILTEGTVVRKEPGGIAINFDSMDLDSYTELKNIVRYNTEDPDTVV